jgi:hypothetical protein
MEWVALRTDIDTLAGGRRLRHDDDGAHRQGSRVPGRVHRRARGVDLPARQLDVRSVSGLEEERRLAYVGITRARERLYLTHAHSRSPLRSHAAQPAEPLHRRDPRGAPDRERARLGRRERHRVRTAGRAASRGLVRHRPCAGRRRRAGVRLGSAAPRGLLAGPAESFEVGATVEHKVFGLGRVTPSMATRSPSRSRRPAPRSC